MYTKNAHSISHLVFEGSLIKTQTGRTSTFSSIHCWKMTRSFKWKFRYTSSARLFQGRCNFSAFFDKRGSSEENSIRVLFGLVNRLRAVTDAVSLLPTVVASPVALGLRTVRRNVSLLATVVALLCHCSSFRSRVSAFAPNVTNLSTVVARLAAVVTGRWHIILRFVRAVASQVVRTVADAASLDLRRTHASRLSFLGVVRAVPLQVLRASTRMTFAHTRLVSCVVSTIVLGAVTFQVANFTADVACLLCTIAATAASATSTVTTSGLGTFTS